MCNEKPCFTSVCGFPLNTSVLGIGLLELVGKKIQHKWILKVITVVATTLNVVKFVGHLELFTECEVRSAQIIMELHSRHQMYVVNDNFSSGQRRLRGSIDKVHRL